MTLPTPHLQDASRPAMPPRPTPASLGEASAQDAARSETGFTAIANELLEAMLEAHLSARQWALCLALIRKTFGYKKIQDDISLSQLADMTKIAKSHISATVNELVLRNIVHKRQGNFGHVLAINMDYTKWLEKPAPTRKSHAKISTNTGQNTVLVTRTDITETGTLRLPNQFGSGYRIGENEVTESGTTKENYTKESLQKKTPKYIALGVLQTRFEDFYQAYPKKKSRRAAEKAFAKLAPDEALLAKMLQAIERARKSAQWTNPQMIPHPATWLNAQAWLDDIQTTYTSAERAVIAAYNAVFSDSLGEVDPDHFVESRAGAIRHFLTLGSKPNWVNIYFRYLGRECFIPKYAGFDWMIKAETFAQVREEHFQRREAR